MALLVQKYEYKDIPKTTKEDGERTYDTPSGKLPSVTTILDKTSDKTQIFEWKKRIGSKNADYITKLSANVGTCFHKHLENFIKDEPRPTGSSLVRKYAKIISDVVIEKGLVKVDQIWGLECSLYFPGLYAGTADVIGIWKGKPAIMDFKNTRRPKKEEWLEGYFLQLTAYAMAHNEMFGTDIQTGVIMMVAREDEYLGEYQEFEIKIKDWEDKWLTVLEKYYGIVKTQTN